MPANELGAVLLRKLGHLFQLDSLVHRAFGRRGHPLETSVGAIGVPRAQMPARRKEERRLAESRTVKSLSVDLYYVG
jgi:hypothetical protein